MPDAFRGTESTEGAESSPPAAIHLAMAPRLARTIVLLVLTCYCFIVILNVLHTGGVSATRMTVCVGVVLLEFGVQFALALPAARAWPLRRRLVTLGVQAVLTYLPAAWFGLDWGSMQGPLAATILLTLPNPVAWPVFGAVVAAAPLYPLLKGSGVLYSGYVFISVTLAGLVIYGLTRLTDLVRELHDTRERLARMAVTQERLRFARDLHDLLGYSLSTVTLKGELVSRLIPVRPEQAAEETTSLLLVARQALADVRLVSRGYRDMSLCDEADSAAKVLVSAEVRVEVDMRVERLHPVVDTVLATALREGVTNILRHSKAEVCTIRATSGTETVLLTLVNDGVTDGGKPDARSCGGSGLGNLRTRLTEIGGELTAGVDEDGLFRLDARAPLQPHQGEAGNAAAAAGPGTERAVA
ncbi:MULTISPECIES: sensor histidine kinase [unclassified Streptomyces]|uniref:sensor histidine kinase n=1 Tax=unclassified Streptomyces TaxID=2593676 RepID=UPI002250AB9F|nr:MULTISPECIES: histidine kinase [unclassified Streptomyces]MCX5055298.1 histidine kinase [Streptomyces sp. NBC_00474]MCX5249985.1 histidine kinase [Streptomyces sp. NBC_00201]